MTVLFHPDFGQDILRFEADYARISPALGAHFRGEIDQAIEAIMRSPGSSGSFLQRGREVIKQFRRRNIRSFPFFIL